MKLKKSVEEYPVHPVTDVVISVPAYFDDAFFVSSNSFDCVSVRGNVHAI